MELTAHTEDGGAWPSAEPAQPAATTPPHKPVRPYYTVHIVQTLYDGS